MSIAEYRNAIQACGTALETVNIRIESILGLIHADLPVGISDVDRIAYGALALAVCDHFSEFWETPMGADFKIELQGSEAVLSGVCWGDDHEYDGSRVDLVDELEIMDRHILAAEKITAHHSLADQLRNHPSAGGILENMRVAAGSAAIALIEGDQSNFLALGYRDIAPGILVHGSLDENAREFLERPSFNQVSKAILNTLRETVNFEDGITLTFKGDGVAAIANVDTKLFRDVKLVVQDQPTVPADHTAYLGM